MKNRRMLKFAGSVMAGAALIAPLTGCATKGFVQKEIAAARGYTDERSAEVRARADQAWNKASLAERLGSGNYTEVSTHQVTFAFDDFRLEPDMQAMLDQLATTLSTHPHYGIELRGYADATGTDRYNYRLGRERAEEVQRYLMTRHSVPSSRMAIISFGEESPVSDNDSEEGRAQNRRVQVRILAIDTSQPVSLMP